jgi:hypothetical protein
MRVRGKGSLSSPILFTALRLPPGNLAREGVQVLLPKSAKLVNPGIDLLKRPRIHRIDSPWPFYSDSDEAVLAQRPEMLRNARLRDAELFLDHVRDTSGAEFATGEEFQNPAPHRIAENIKSMHDRSVHFSFGQCRKPWFARQPRALPPPEFLLRLRRGAIHRCCG